MAQSSRKVKVGELQPGMIIEEVTELSFDYAILEEKSLKFLQTAFKGAQAELVGEGGKRLVPVEDLKPFDPLQGIVAIPPDLKVAKVVPGLAERLEGQGLLEFKVTISDGQGPATHTEDKSTPPGILEVGSPQASKRFEAKKEEVKAFIETLDKAEENRDKSSNTVEEMLDAGRGGKYSAKGVETMIDSILESGSSPAMRAIAGLKGSDQTYAHCTDMSVILQDCYTDILQRTGKKPSEANARFALTSGFMHDIGKSEVPKDILESTTRFAPDSQEMIIMRNHTTYGARILTDMNMPQQAINVAAYHHVKKDSTLLTSYPQVDYKEVMPLARLASITDVYQALIGRRKYKKNWVPGKAIEFLLSLKDTEFDGRMLDEFIESMGKFPVGSLVKLTTGDLAFVMALAPKEHSGRPVVALVENAKGELLKHQTLVDLMVEKELEVVEVVDHYEHYNESEEQAFQIFQSIRVA